jgi:hypothetical protein
MPFPQFSDSTTTAPARMDKRLDAATSDAVDAPRCLASAAWLRQKTELLQPLPPKEHSND